MKHPAIIVQDEPKPGPNSERVLDDIREDLTSDPVKYGSLVHVIEKRAEFGKEKHGEYLKTHNDRDFVIDAYQETLDQIFYIRGKMMEIDDNLIETSSMDKQAFDLPIRIKEKVLEQLENIYYKALDILLVLHNLIEFEYYEEIE